MSLCAPALAFKVQYDLASRQHKFFAPVMRSHMMESCSSRQGWGISPGVLLPRDQAIVSIVDAFWRSCEIVVSSLSRRAACWGE